MTPLGRPVEEDDLHARIDGQLPRERAEDVEAYLAAHPEEQERFAQYARQREALRAAFSSHVYGPIPNRLRVAHLLAQLRRRRRRQLGGIVAAVCLIVLGGTGGWAARDLAGPMSSCTSKPLRTALERKICPRREDPAEFSRICSRNKALLSAS